MLLVIVVLCLIAVCFHIGMVARKARMRGVCLRDQGSGDAELKELELRELHVYYCLHVMFIHVVLVFFKILVSNHLYFVIHVAYLHSKMSVLV